MTKLSKIDPVFVQESLAAHNRYRSRHNAVPLKLDTQLMKQSQACAEDLLTAETIGYSKFPTVGENVYIITISDPTYCPKGGDPVDVWYSQKDNITPGEEPPLNNQAVNFSQLVWKNTQYLGVGLARDNSRVVVVCQYSPVGNVTGMYVQNVEPETETLIVA